ncbi:MAG TPA: hypothetical protein VH419_12250 [Nocardioidaceae bacterium]
MSDSTRRGFLALVGAGAATAATAAAAPGSLAADDWAPKITSHRPLVAYVTDPSKGRVSVMVGEREVVVHDRDLVARLLRAARKG